MPEITDTSYREALAAAVRAEFGRRGINRTALAGALGVTRPTAALRWSGQAPMDANEIEAVADFLGMTVDQLNESAALGLQHRSVKNPLSEVERLLPVDEFAQPARAKRSAGR